MAVTLTAAEAKALAAYIRARGFDYAEASTIGVILEKCDRAESGDDPPQ